MPGLSACQSLIKDAMADENQYSIAIANNSDAEAWSEYVKTHAEAKIYHLYAWKALIEKSFGHQAKYIIARDEFDHVCGVLPLIYMNSAVFGKVFGKSGNSMPYFNYGGPIGDSAEIESLLISEAEKQFKGTNAEYLEYRDSKARSGYPSKTEKITLILRLKDNADDMFSCFKAKLRSQIRRPVRENVVVKFGGLECLESFYDVFCENMRDLGTPPYSKHFFANILSIFPDNAFLAIATKDGEAVGAAFLIGFKDTLEIPWASTLRKYNSIGVNMLMYWEVIKQAIKLKYKYFDFGRCSKGSGTHKFKKQWGSEEVPLYWHYSLLTMEKLPKVNPKNSKYKGFIAVWQKLPIGITRLLGPYIVRNIP